jgi:hypothetical protein
MGVLAGDQELGGLGVGLQGALVYCQFLQPEEVLLLDAAAAFAQHVPRVVTLDHVTAVPAASATDLQAVAEAAGQQAEREFEA